MARGGSPWASVQYERIDLKGGVDMVTPTYNLPPGVCRSAVNFEISFTGGYRRIAGYERYDGHTSPSGAVYNVMQLSSVAAMSVGTAITGHTSGATATVCGVTQIATNPNTIGYTLTTGVFQLGEQIYVGGVSVATVTSLTNALSDPYTNAIFDAAAADLYRALISAPPGSGGLIGVQYLNQVVYAWRNNAGGTVLNIYKSTTSGWTQVPYGYELGYTTATGGPYSTTPPAVGSTVKGSVSGATGVVAAVVNETGAVVQGVPTWYNSTGPSTSTGRLILSSVTGTWSASDVIQNSGGTVSYATATTPLAVQIQPNPGQSSRMSFSQGSLGGANTNATIIYGASGTDRCFSFDGTTFIPIRTLPAAQQSSDRPTVVAVHLNYLIAAQGASINISGLGLPYQFNALAGGAEILMPYPVTNLYPLPGNQATGALYIGTQFSTSILYGTSTANFQLVPYNIKVGSMFNTAQNMSDLYVWEQRGAVSLTTTLAYGNFDPAFLTMNLQPYVIAHQGLTNCAIASRVRSEYRVFFEGGDALYMTFLNKQYLGAMPVNFPNDVDCICEGPDANGNQLMFFGGDNGYVYQLDVGTSFDGQPIPATFTLVIDPIRSPRVLKRYRKASFEITGGSYATFTFSYSLGWGSPLIGQPAAELGALPFQSPTWDSVYWDAFYWDGNALSPTEVEVRGTAENLAFQVSSSTNYMQPYTINSIFLHYSVRRGLR